MLENYQSIEQIKNHTYKDLQSEIFPAQRKKVMVIDDDQDFRLFVCELLVDEGFTVTTAKDGEVGIDNLVHQNDLPDLILVDVMMPRKNGFEFRKEQLRHLELSHIPVIFMTGHGYVEGESCIMKPFDHRDFIQKIRSKMD